MRTRRIHILGATGAGVTTLGLGVAGALALPYHDADDYFWLPTTPPYRDRRAIADRLRLMHDMFIGRPHWVLAGSIDHWGDSVIPYFDVAVFLLTSTPTRLQRLRIREAQRFGLEAISVGGSRQEEAEGLIKLASQYDAGGHRRNLARHETWLSKLPCRVIRLDGERPAACLIEEVCAFL